MEISGQTKIYVIVADPILQVKTPQNINKWIAKAGADAVLVPMHVAAESLKAWVDAMRAIKNLGGMPIIDHAIPSDGLLSGSIRDLLRLALRLTPPED